LWGWLWFRRSADKVSSNSSGASRAISGCVDSALSALAFLAVTLGGTIFALLAALIFGVASIAAMIAEPFLRNQFPDPRGGLDLQLAAKRTAAPHAPNAAAVRDPLAEQWRRRVAEAIGWGA
jgi:hypothetical protein